MVRDIGRVLAQLDDARLWRIVVKAALAALVLLALVVTAITTAANWFVATGYGWLDALAPWLAGTGSVVLALLVLPLAAMSVLGLFVDDVAAAVEARCYPDLPPATPLGIAAGAVQSLRLLLVAGVLNLLALPFYLLLPGLNVVLFLILNGYLLGREYFEAVATRRLTSSAAAALRREHRGAVFAAGVLIAAVALVPGVNLLVPVLGTALMVHRVQRLWRPPGGPNQ